MSAAAPRGGRDGSQVRRSHGAADGGHACRGPWVVSEGGAVRRGPERCPAAAHACAAAGYPGVALSSLSSEAAWRASTESTARRMHTVRAPMRTSQTNALSEAPPKKRGLLYQPPHSRIHYLLYTILLVHEASAVHGHGAWAAGTCHKAGMGASHACAQNDVYPGAKSTQTWGWMWMGESHWATACT